MTVPEVKGSEDLMTVVGRFGYGMIILAAIIWGLSWVFVSCLNYAAARQVSNSLLFSRLTIQIFFSRFLIFVVSFYKQF